LLTAIITISYGVFLFNHDIVYFKVAGHKVLGLGLICLCIATETVICTKFNKIRENNILKSDSYQANFSKNYSRLLILIPILAVLVGWAWAIYLLMNPDINDNFIPGHVMAGMAMICTCVLAAAITTIKQINNTYKDIDKKIWPGLAFTVGLISIIWGLILLLIDKNPATYLSPGFILIGISCVCFSIFSKLILVSRSWRAEFKNIPSVLLISLFLALICFSLSFFLFQGAVNDLNIYIPARVLVGLGFVCLSLFAVINIMGISKVGDS
jgi:heme A synthase